MEKISSDIDWQSLPKKERRRLKKELEKERGTAEQRKKKFLKWVVVLGAIVFLAGGFFLFRFFQEKRFANAPRLEVTPAAFDFGKISLKEKKQTSFLIKNSGVSPLTISGAKTSCDCTTAQFKIKEKESPIFGMHETPSWSATLEVGGTGELVVFYEPQVHPVTGPITREVSLFSNDPATPEKRVTIYAQVEK